MIMTSSEYLIALSELEVELCNEYKFSRAIAKKIVSRADDEYHCYSFDEVYQAAYSLAYFVTDCLKLANDA